MKHDPVVHSASYLTPEGFGNNRKGAQPWRAEDGASETPMDPSRVAWSSLFSSSCPRFGRMDLLSRLGLMAVELLGVEFAAMSEEDRDEVGVALMTPSGSLSTDIDFLKEISPSTFIYTLPSSVIGEICIRHRLRGPVLCLTSDAVSGRSIVDEAAERIRLGEARSMLCLACEARSPEASRVLDFSLDKQRSFCWDVYAIYLVRRGVEPTGVERVIDAGVEVRQVCADLCNSEE
jgi:3-oxoacyl-(acyl-carrier-protein) synthase